MYVLYNKDCTTVMDEIEECCIDLTVTSPPYDNLRDYSGSEWNEKIYKRILDSGEECKYFVEMYGFSSICMFAPAPKTCVFGLKNWED